MNELVNGNYQKKPRRILGTNHQEQLENQREIGDAPEVPVSKSSSSVAINLPTNNNMDNISDCRSFWPLGQFITPVCAPGLPVFPASIPFFPFYQAGMFGSNYENYPPRYAQTSINNSRPLEPNMTIQIGLQCVNQNNPVNINAYNGEMSTSTQKFSKQKFGSSTTTAINSADQAVAQYSGNVNAIMNGISAKTIPGRDFSEEKISEMISIAIKGCEIAERLSNDYRNRPCFKKIDSLCVRTKTDLLRADGIIANINSQGTAWAIKDFIFVFTRIINAWIIIKGYTCNNHEGLDNIKSALSNDFISSFEIWQNATIDFVDNIIKSFVNLNTLVQSQMQKHGNNNTTTNNTAKNSNSTCSGNDENINKLLNESNNIETLENITKDTDLNDYIMKTGTYKVLKGKLTDSIATNDDNTLLGNCHNTLPSNCSINIPFNGEGDGGGCPDTSSLNNGQNDCKSHHDPIIDYTFVNEEQSFFNPIQIYKPICKDLTENLEYLLKRISNIPAGQYFFTANFTRNYFPDFTSKFPNFMDLRSIIIKAQVGGYSHINEIVHDLKLIIFHAKIYLIVMELIFIFIVVFRIPFLHRYIENNQNELLRNSIIEYENEINNILLTKTFICWSFDHIQGDPHEQIYIDQKNNNKVKNHKEHIAEEKNFVYSSIKLQKQ